MGRSSLWVRTSTVSGGSQILLKKWALGLPWSSHCRSAPVPGLKLPMDSARNVQLYRRRWVRTDTGRLTGVRCISPTLPRRFPRLASGPFANREKQRKWQKGPGACSQRNGRGTQFDHACGQRQKNVFEKRTSHIDFYGRTRLLQSLTEDLA